MNPLELEIEDIARTALCPTCGAQPGHKCRVPSTRSAAVVASSHSHLSRLKVARGERL